MKASEAQTRLVKWKERLSVELHFQSALKGLTATELEAIVRARGILSSNYDTVVSIDWPHYCVHATEGCGGARGWCYTFAGNHAMPDHARKVALVDIVATKHPELFASQVAVEVDALTGKGKLSYRNVRYSGTGEAHLRHLKALELTAKQGIRLWGFTRNLAFARRLRALGIASLISCDKTTPADIVSEAGRAGFGLAYTSVSVVDLPPAGTVVTFPLHTSGRVREVVDDSSLCPKVVEEYLTGTRRSGWCQTRCQRCHLPNP